MATMSWKSASLRTWKWSVRVTRWRSIELSTLCREIASIRCYRAISRTNRLEWQAKLHRERSVIFNLSGYLWNCLHIHVTLRDLLKWAQSAVPCNPITTERIGNQSVRSGRNCDQLHKTFQVLMHRQLFRNKRSHPWKHVLDIIWYDMIWYDMIWYDMIWYDMIWYESDGTHTEQTLTGAFGKCKTSAGSCSVVESYQWNILMKFDGEIKNSLFKFPPATAYWSNVTPCKLTACGSAPRLKTKHRCSWIKDRRAIKDADRS
jgi:hypothetical protein